jgi:spore coat polysaccharide biosynthesis protein SpsF (cytidylyltransferase family)
MTLPPPLAIVQARMGSKRLPGKVLLPIHGVPLIEHVWRRTVKAFGKQHTVVAHPDTPENAPLVEVLESLGAQRFAWDGPENDVLSRFYYCAHRYRWHPDSVIVRVTADDWRKNPAMMKRVANGERLPVELGAEAFTLAMLDEAQGTVGFQADYREHITHALFPTAPPKPPPGIWTIDTAEDLAAAQGVLA